MKKSPISQGIQNDQIINQEADQGEDEGHRVVRER
jgi:hypothetical protein